jgi:DNA-binding MarR family transcriptional regulator
MQDLAARVLLSRTRVSRLVDDIVHAGLVERNPDPDDGRATFAVITPKGRDELRHTAPRYLAGIDAHFASLFTAQEREQLTGLLQRVADRHANARFAR